MYDIITVGSATVDVFGETDKKFIVRKKYSFPVGSKILVKHLEFHTGGGATNTAVAFARLGLRTGCIIKIGCGDNSERIINVLKKEKIDTSLVCRENGRTGYSFIIDAEGSDRTILNYRGSNNDLKYNEIDKRKLKTRWFYFSSMLGASHKTQERLAEFAEKNKILIAYNMSPYIASRGIKFSQKILKRTEILILNKEEAQLLVGKKGITNQIKALHALGPHIIVITDGKNGAYASYGRMIGHVKNHRSIDRWHDAKASSQLDGPVVLEHAQKYTTIHNWIADFVHWSNRPVVYFRHIKARMVKIKETTGAGDAFAASFVASMIKTNNIELSLQIALANAESVITHYGAKNLLLRWGTALKQARKSPAKIKKML